MKERSLSGFELISKNKLINGKLPQPYIFPDKSETMESTESVQNIFSSETNAKLSITKDFFHTIYLSGSERVLRNRVKKENFNFIRVVGKGAFGVVWLAEDNTSKQKYAIKVLKKTDISLRNSLANVYAEVNILRNDFDPWIVKFFYYFQDKSSVYLVMEFLPGGSLLDLLEREGRFTENATRFYVAEILLAMHCLHNKGFIHRDIKPDNILTTNEGHIKLADFGLAVEKVGDNFGCSALDTFGSNKAGGNGLKKLFECHVAGTPNYIAPELVDVNSNSSYDCGVDLWSLGVVMYEMLFGVCPFAGVDTQHVLENVIHWKEKLVFPSDPVVSEEAKDLLVRLLCDKEVRIEFEEIKKHKFFDGFNWSNVRSMDSPYKPNVDTQEYSSFGSDSKPPQDVEVPVDDIMDLALMSLNYSVPISTNV